MDRRKPHGQTATRTDSNTDPSPTTTHMVHHHSFSKAQTIGRSTSGPTATSPKKKHHLRSEKWTEAPKADPHMRGPPRSGERWTMNEKQRKTWENEVSHTKREAYGVIIHCHAGENVWQYKKHKQLLASTLEFDRRQGQS